MYNFNNRYFLDYGKFYIVDWVDCSMPYAPNNCDEYVLCITYVDIDELKINRVDFKEFKENYKKAKGKDNRINWWREIKEWEGYLYQCSQEK
jgi:hypothetical protein